MSEDDKRSVKAKLPDARSISRTDFTPHGIKSTGGSRPSGLTAAEAKKRRNIGVAIAAVVVLAVGGVVTYVATRPAPEIKVSGKFNAAPTITIPKSSDLKPGKKLVVKTLIQGTGATLAKGDTSFVKAAGYDWTSTGSKKLPFAYSSAAAIPVGQSSQVLTGLLNSLPGKKVGTRMLIEMPPADGYGKQGNPNLGVAATDSLVFVVDVVGTVNKNAVASGTPQPLTDPKLPAVSPGTGTPTITIPKNDPPSTTTAKVLIQGNGATVAKGQTLAVNYHGVVWSTGKVFDSSFTKGSLASFPIGIGGVIPGWDKTLVGQKVGSRILLMIPPADGYGKTGNPQGGIKGTDTLVFVVDILGAF
jgi:FKBP-type peptidyl-prolyl cis-trans isomerase